MVKNKKGGSGHKRLARKNVKEQFAKRKLRKTYEEGEVYAKVTNVNGGGMFDVMCFNDKKIRLLVVRKKFKGRNKRSNQLYDGCIVLVGLRDDWEVVKPGKLPKCDLLEVYNRDQMNELKAIKEMKLFDELGNEDDEQIEFTNDIEIEDYVKKSNTVVSSTSNLKEELKDNEFDWDDI